MPESKKYLNQFIALLFWIFFVVLFFKFIPDKRWAAVCAGLGFLFWPFLFLIFEWRRKPRQNIHIAILLLFLIGNALPIFFLRLLNWDVEFSTLSFLGLPAEKLHRLSNILYLWMMGSCLYHYFKWRPISKARTE